MKKIWITGGAGFIGSNLVMQLQEEYPLADLTVMDDLRSGSFLNLEGFRGDFVAADLSRLDWEGQFKGQRPEAMFHLASITDTTLQDQKIQTHDNVESFRRLLEYLRPEKTPVVYASSAATYGIRAGVNRLGDPLAPANAYAFSKVQLENLAKKMHKEEPSWKIAGLRYFNVYGPREGHKGVPASMAWHLAGQMLIGKRPKIFTSGEQKRDFVYVKDIVAFTLAAMKSGKSGVWNAGSGQPRSFNEMVQGLNGVLGTKLQPEYFECPYPFYQPHTEADMSATEQDLKIRPKFSLEQGLADYEKSGWLTRGRLTGKAKK
jgi:ADP-L-glycero-D-manno-heptose 6-epimerase